LSKICTQFTGIFITHTQVHTPGYNEVNITTQHLHYCLISPACKLRLFYAILCYDLPGSAVSFIAVSQKVRFAEQMNLTQNVCFKMFYNCYL